MEAPTLSSQTSEVHVKVNGLKKPTVLVVDVEQNVG